MRRTSRPSILPPIATDASVALPAMVLKSPVNWTQLRPRRFNSAQIAVMRMYSGTFVLPLLPSLLRTRNVRPTGALRAHRVIFMICVLHISNTLRPVTTRCGNSDLSPSFGYQDRQSIIPRGGKFRARPVVQFHIALAIRQLQAFIKESFRSRPPSSSRFDTKWDELDILDCPTPFKYDSMAQLSYEYLGN